jgi:predicted CXXCH cytochrome family protein
MKKTTLIFAILLICLSVVAVAHAEEVDCLMCHPEKGEGAHVHPAVTMGCTTCHTGVDASNIPHKFSGTAPRGLAMVAPDLCFMCHDASKFSGAKDVHPPVTAGMCTSCHDPHTSENEKLLVAAPPDLCYTCHEKRKFYGPVVHPPVASGMCTTCHAPHQSENPNLMIMSELDLCMMCHDRGEFFKKSVHKPVEEGMCTECHSPHAGPNDHLVYRKGNILCRKCHAKIERQPHAIAGFSQKGHPVRGRRDPLRSGQTFGCLSCHVPHTSDSPLLFRYEAADMYGLCTYCHKNI